MSRFSGEAKALIAKADSIGFDESELAAALGTIELEHGNPKRARRLLRAALVSPAENAIAQVSWANRRRGASIDLPKEVAMQHRCFEALAWDSAHNGNVEVAIENCRLWLSEEPFSVKPAILGSFFGVVSGLCLESAADIAANGVAANPNHALMANNLVVALLEVGRLQEAEAKLSRIRRRGLSPEMLVTLQATEGLLAFRGGRPAEGDALYRSAIDRATALGDEYLRDMADVHLHIEKARLGDVSAGAADLMKRASVAGELGLRLAAARLMALMEAPKKNESASGRQIGGVEGVL
ncbi:MAG: hypothetical protein IPK26_03035 [Planctomycetes bacterium]|nr:hypothetical protein [Planctomycetota bacterium]